MDLSDVPSTGEDTASKSLEVTLARKDNRPRAPDQAEDSSSPIVSSLRNKYFETSHCFGLSITPPLDHSKSDRTLSKTSYYYPIEKLIAAQNLYLEFTKTDQERKSNMIK